MSQTGAASADVAMLRIAVDAFQTREISFRDVLDDLPAAIYTTDADGRLTYFNKACVDFSGRTPTIGDDLWCVTWKLYTMAGEPLPHDQCPMAVALRTRRPIRGAEAVAERPDGSRLTFQPYPTPIFDELGNLLGAVNMLVDISEQKKAQEHLALVAREVDHRANNLLAVMQGLMQFTKADTIKAYRAALEGRFASLARANALIAGRRWTNVNLKALVEEEVRAFAPGRIDVVSDSLDIPPAAAQCWSMVVHELCTNALKYGALANDEGRVAIAWTPTDDGGLHFAWREQGAAVATPSRTGTGTSIIAATVRRLGGKVTRDWTRSGLHLAIRCAPDC